MRDTIYIRQFIKRLWDIFYIYQKATICDMAYYMWKMTKRNPTCIGQASIVLKYRGPLKSPAPGIM